MATVVINILEINRKLHDMYKGSNRAYETSGKSFTNY